jgi:cytochrome c
LRAVVSQKYLNPTSRQAQHGASVSIKRIAPSVVNPTGPDSKAKGDYTFPPVWGRESYNKGAGMHRNSTAAAFIKANMPLGQGGTLTNQQAWDVAAYINSKPRPADPRTRRGSSQ